jgi:excisionase family DNA binding protein
MFEESAVTVMGKRGEAGPRVAFVSLAEMYAISVRTLRRHVATGALKAYRVGRLVRVRLTDLDRLARPIPAGRGGSGGD